MSLLLSERWSRPFSWDTHNELSFAIFTDRMFAPFILLDSDVKETKLFVDLIK